MDLRRKGVANAERVRELVDSAFATRYHDLEATLKAASMAVVLAEEKRDELPTDLVVAAWTEYGNALRIVDAHLNPYKFGPSVEEQHHPARSAATGRRGEQRSCKQLLSGVNVHFCGSLCYRLVPFRPPAHFRLLQSAISPPQAGDHMVQISADSRER
jgi:hypothetical protein